MRVDKVLITNAKALKQKYGQSGYLRVVKAIEALIKADEKRGLLTRVIDVSSRREMNELGGAAVRDPRSQSSNKRAIDRVYAALNPSYLVILDGPDVVPHIGLRSAVPHDGDTHVPTDLPYACDAPLRRDKITDFAAVTRVVGRIPGLTGASDPASLVAQILSAAKFKGRARRAYLRYFILSAKQFQKPAAQLAEKVFNDRSISKSPPLRSPAIRRRLRSLMHILNCHGRKHDGNVYGEAGAKLVVAVSSDDLTGCKLEGTVVATECCFGAELFAPRNQSQVPLANAYLTAGASALFGSTNVAFGAVNEMGAADLLMQYFLLYVLDGASVGRACLQARQQFVRSQKMSNPINLKTLAQFILLGDPSLQAVVKSAASDPLLKEADAREARRNRRVALSAEGRAAHDCSFFPGRKLNPKSELHDELLNIAYAQGFQKQNTVIDGFGTIGHFGGGGVMKADAAGQKVFLISAKRKRQTRQPRSRFIVVHVQNNRISHLYDYASR